MFQKAKSRVVASVVATSAFLFTAAAHAALDPAVKTTLDEIKGDATELNGLVMPIVLSILGMGILYKLVKRFGNKV